VKIGDQEITRDMLPAMQAWQMNPDHLRQSFQDVLNAKLAGGLQMPQTNPNSGMMQTQENRESQWR
jgi:hypothetical protein